jgi:hypothetical protein
MFSLPLSTLQPLLVVMVLLIHLLFADHYRSLALPALVVTGCPAPYRQQQLLPPRVDLGQ